MSKKLILESLPNLEEIVSKLRCLSTENVTENHINSIRDRLLPGSALEQIEHTHNHLVKALIETNSFLNYFVFLPKIQDFGSKTPEIQLNREEKKEKISSLIKSLEHSILLEKCRFSHYHKTRFCWFYDLQYHEPLLESDEIAGMKLELRSLDSISDEEALIIIRVFGCLHIGDLGYITEYSPIEKIKKAISKVNFFPQQIADYLREQMFAIPYRDLSVKELVEMGWVVLIEQNNLES